MTEPRWLTLPVIRAIHSDQVREHGGSLGLRDAGLLESALARPVDRFQYQEEPDLCDLAAVYGFGFARNHPFVDGNKRVAFQAMYVFLGLNGSHRKGGYEMSSKKARRRERRTREEEEGRGTRLNPVTVFVVGIAVAIVLLAAGAMLLRDSGPGEPPWPGAVWSSSHGHWH